MNAPKVYLAGPDIFRRDCLEHAKWQKEICLKYGVEPLHPMDNNHEPDYDNYDWAKKIYALDVEQMLKCDAICANMNDFRGAEPDGGTVFEVGFVVGFSKALEMFAKTQPQKRVYGYVDEKVLWGERAARAGYRNENDPDWDINDMRIEPIADLCVNPMMEVPMRESGGFITTGFEDCIKKIAADWQARHAKGA